MKLDLSARKKEILSAVIKSYISNGDPVGSKAVCSMLNTKISPATVRNEMNLLCEMGYLKQPHTSAGRIPTNKGYKMYISDLMEQRRITDGMKKTIDIELEKAGKYPEQLLSLAGGILANITGFPAIVIKSVKQERYVRRIEFLPTGKRTVMMVLITSDGIVKSRLCRANEVLTADMLSDFDKLAASRIIGTELSKFNKAFLQSLAAELGIYALPLLQLLGVIFEMVMDINSSTVRIAGESNLFSCCSDEMEAKGLLNLFSRKQQILNALESVNSPVEVIFGGDTGIEELKPSNMVVAQFKLGANDAGKIGIIGPKRIDYERILPDIEYFADKLSELITENMSDMED